MTSYEAIKAYRAEQKEENVATGADCVTSSPSCTIWLQFFRSSAFKVRVNGAPGTFGVLAHMCCLLGQELENGLRFFRAIVLKGAISLGQ